MPHHGCVSAHRIRHIAFKLSKAPNATVKVVGTSDLTVSACIPGCNDGFRFRI